MLEADIIADVRRGCRNPRLSSSDISAMILRGVTHLGQHVKQADQSYYMTRKSATSSTHVFDKPSDCIRIEKIWDMGYYGFDITGAVTSAGSILLTVPDHSFLRPTDVFDYTLSFTFGAATADIATVHDVTGTTEANGVWNVIYDDADHVLLVGSTFSNAYASGGRIFLNPLNPKAIDKIPLRKATSSNPNGWYPRGSQIVVDDLTFTNDIIIDYDKAPTAITDIETPYHEGLVSFCVVRMIRIPKPDDPMYQDLVEQKRYHQGILNETINAIYGNLKATSEPSQIYNWWCD